MPERTRPPYRADHIGSLKRPQSLLKAREDFQTGKISRERLKEAEDEAIKSVIVLQKRFGIKSITDGEYRRMLFFDGFFENIEGIEVTRGLPLSLARSSISSPASWLKIESLTVPLVVSNLKRTKPIYLSDFEALKTLVEKEDVPNIKLTMCSPVWYDFRYGKNWIREGSGVYDSRVELMEDLAAIYRAELADLYTAGCRNIQIDEPTFTFLCYPPTIEGFKQEEGLEIDDILDEYIGVFNECLKDVPKDMTVGVHLCRGNFRGRHFVEGSYDPIAKKLFNNLNVNCFYLEYDTERAGGFDPLVHLPKEKVAVLGLVSTKTPVLETPELLMSRIEEAVQVIVKAHPERSKEEVLNQLCLSPQCGFASELQGNPITEEDVEKKLKLISDVSKKVWA